jgi:hypothetical protein
VQAILFHGREDFVCFSARVHDAAGRRDLLSRLAPECPGALGPREWHYSTVRRRTEGDTLKRIRRIEITTFKRYRTVTPTGSPGGGPPDLYHDANGRAPGGAEDAPGGPAATVLQRLLAALGLDGDRRPDQQ